MLYQLEIIQWMNTIKQKQVEMTFRIKSYFENTS